MIIQLSSGQGPSECELAVAGITGALMKEYPGSTITESRPGHVKGGLASVMIETCEDLSSLEGTMLWICKSPLRPEHKRKNWFIDVSVIPEIEETDIKGEIRFERFHCGGNGGQNVNKVETGVRLTHIPTGIVVTSTSQRSQYQNRRNALTKLTAILIERQEKLIAGQKGTAWIEQKRLIRGNPVRTYSGMEFKRTK